jgi:hypothetical protein
MGKYDRINQNRKHSDTLPSEIVKPEMPPPSMSVEHRGKNMFNPDYVHIARVMLEAGSKYSDLARAFQVDVKTVYRWMKDYPTFKEAVTEAQDWFNTQLAETALVKRATGYDYNEDTFERQRVSDIGSGKGEKFDMILTRRVKKHVAPSERAIEYFLNNRSRFMPDKNGDSRWAHTNKLEVTGKDGKDLIPDSISPEKLLAELIMQQKNQDDIVDAELVEAKQIGVATSEESHNEADIPDAR